MRYQALRGDIAASVRQYFDCQQALAQHLDLKPSAETEGLLQEIRRRTFSRNIAPSLSPVTTAQDLSLDLGIIKHEGFLGPLPTSSPVATPLQARYTRFNFQAPDQLATFGRRQNGSRPGIFENVPQRDLNFTGRDLILSELHQLLMGAYQPAAITQAAIHGLGGIGKTSLATEYTHRYASEYAGVWWAPAENRTVLLASLATLAGRLEPQLAEEADQEKAARAGLAHLARSAEPFLLIYDNVETPDVLQDLLPSAEARVLLTTRWTDWGGRAAELELDVLGAEAAVEFLQKRAGRTNGPGARRLAEALGCLPLALDHAGAYCRLSGLSFDAYHNKVDELIARVPKGTAYLASVGATFGLAIDKAAAECPAAEVLLAVCAYLAPDNIPLDLVVNEIPDEAERAEALMTLAAVSLVEHAELDGGEPAVVLHRLVQAEMRARLVQLGTAKSISERVTRWLAAAFPKTAYRETSITFWPRCAMLLPHVLALRNQLPPDADLVELAGLLTAAGSYLHRRGAYAEAEPLLKDALAIGEKTLGSEHPDVATWLGNLGHLYRTTGHYAEAEPLFREALAISKKMIGDKYPDIATSLSSLALIYCDLGRYAEAEPLLREALIIAEETLGYEHPIIGIRLKNLANLYRVTGRYSEAEPLYKKSLTIGEKTLGRQHPDIAIRLNHLANFYRDIGRYSEAEPLYKEALAAGEHALGRGHPRLASRLNDLGGLYLDIGRYDEAEPLLKEALATNEKALGREHPNVAIQLNDLANLYRATGRYAEAEPLFREALAICEMTLGPSNPGTARVQRNFAEFLLNIGRNDEALEQACAALSINESVYGIDHPWTTASAKICATALLSLGRSADAADVFARYKDRL
jgi:tetratricopeptide (TPR) repeat protein